MKIPYNTIFCFINQQCKQFNIDESHAIKHSLEVFRHSKNNYEKELSHFPQLKKQKRVIYTSALLHDMFDDKYVEPKYMKYLDTFLTKKLNYHSWETKAISEIINTMSYSKVKMYGFPDLKEFQLSYNIVREADLLCAYDLDRAIIYSIIHNNKSFSQALNNTINLYYERMDNHIKDNLFKTDYGLSTAQILHNESNQRIEELKQLNNFLNNNII